MFPKLLEVLVSNAPAVLAILLVTPLLYAVVFGRNVGRNARGCRRARALLLALRNPHGK